jgi:HAD superfamily hydrolase (TIGR01549 family)
MIKAILFDFGQTLVDSADGFRAAEKEAQTKIFSDLAVSSWEVFLSAYREIRKESHEMSIFSRKTIWLKAYTHYGKKPDLNLLEKWEDDYWEKVRSETKPFPETEQVLKTLSSSYRLAMITNTQGQKISRKHRINEYPEIERFFELIIVAGESDVPPKPDPAPFLLCLKRLGIGHSEAVYVGDDWRIDICGARNVGIQPIWIQHESVRRSWPALETTVPIITSLDPLLKVESIFLGGNFP